jgi:glycosyltransferase involved in cell wall biosynthesis
MPKRVLIITYFFPPRPGVAALRLKGLAKYLPEFGWEPVILTPKLPGPPDPQFNVIETEDPGTVTQQIKRKIGLQPQRGLQQQIGIPVALRGKKQSFTSKFIFQTKGMITYPDDRKLWRSYAVSAGLEALNENRFDLILSSFGPVTAHLVAQELKTKTGLPWVADFRDLWTQNHYYRYNPVRKRFESRLETRTMALADALVTVSQPLANQLALINQDKPVYTITNGFDPDELNRDTPLTKRFTITYTGQLYQGKRDPTPLFQAVQELISAKKINPGDIQIRFYGPPAYWLDQEIKKYHLEGVVVQGGVIPHEQAVIKQRESQILLFLQWDNPNEAGVYTGKLFEYLAAKRPILALGGPQGVVGDLLTETRAGIHINNPDQLKTQLLTWYQAYTRQNSVPYRGIEERILGYSHRAMAKKFADVMNQTLLKHPSAASG